jgi:phosphoribosylanthranilate isomerase
LLLDAYAEGSAGGAGRPFDWLIAREAAARRRIILAGGLTPENVQEAIALVHPYAVDVSSGVEREPGRKDHAKLEEFIRKAKS